MRASRSPTSRPWEIPIPLPWPSGPRDYLFVGPLHGPRFDSIRVASLHRQGPRPDLLEKVIADPASIGPDSV